MWSHKPEKIMDGPWMLECEVEQEQAFNIIIITRTATTTINAHAASRWRRRPMRPWRARIVMGSRIRFADDDAH
jgi:hypothetical protein